MRRLWQRMRPACTARMHAYTPLSKSDTMVVSTGSRGMCWSCQSPVGRAPAGRSVMRVATEWEVGQTGRGQPPSGKHGIACCTQRCTRVWHRPQDAQTPAQQFTRSTMDAEAPSGVTAPGAGSQDALNATH